MRPAFFPPPTLTCPGHPIFSFRAFSKRISQCFCARRYQFNLAYTDGILQLNNKRHCMGPAINTKAHWMYNRDRLKAYQGVVLILGFAVLF